MKKSIITRFALIAALLAASAAWIRAADEAPAAGKEAAVESKAEMVDVTFKYTPSRREKATLTEVTLAGEFNNWDPFATELVKGEDGSFSVTIKLEKGKSYLWKFLLNGSWIQSMEAYAERLTPTPDEYVPDPYGGKNAKYTVK